MNRKYSEVLFLPQPTTALCFFYQDNCLHFSEDAGSRFMPTYWAWATGRELSVRPSICNGLMNGDKLFILIPLWC